MSVQNIYRPQATGARHDSGEPAGYRHRPAIPEGMGLNPLTPPSVEEYARMRRNVQVKAAWLVRDHEVRIDAEVEKERQRIDAALARMDQRLIEERSRLIAERELLHARADDLRGEIEALRERSLELLAERQKATNRAKGLEKQVTRWKDKAEQEGVAVEALRRVTKKARHTSPEGTDENTRRVRAARALAPRVVARLLDGRDPKTLDEADLRIIEGQADMADRNNRKQAEKRRKMAL